MPLDNDLNKLWTGWLIEGLVEKEEEYLDALIAALEARSIPDSNLKTGRECYLWYGGRSSSIDVISEQEGIIMSTIHIMKYGRSLLVARAVDSFSQSNYYKRIKISAVIRTIDLCIRETDLTMVDARAIHDLVDIYR